MNNKGKEYIVSLKNKEGNVSEIGKVIFNSYNFPFRDNDIESLKFNTIYLDIYVPSTTKLIMT